MRLIKEAGFSGIIGIMWSDIFDANYKKFPEYARNAGLYVENMHAMWTGANELWADNLAGQNFMEEIIENFPNMRETRDYMLKICTRCGRVQMNYGLTV